jgi:hypothetical protein
LSVFPFVPSCLTAHVNVVLACGVEVVVGTARAGSLLVVERPLAQRAAAAAKPRAVEVAAETATPEAQARASAGGGERSDGDGGAEAAAAALPDGFQEAVENGIKLVRVRVRARLNLLTVFLFVRRFGILSFFKLLLLRSPIRCLSACLTFW